ncbi:MAG: exosortase/archaeosortase family protein [Lentisphaerae bacterium]|jgi:exosortase|nr:exosortase/archaeosortase family protein [Lentisphaerota bacterium]
MQKTWNQFRAWAGGFRWTLPSPGAQREIGFWALVAGALFFLYHLHGNNQEVASARHSLFLWLGTRWKGDYAYCMLLPLASLAALWIRRRDIAAAPRRVDWRGAPVVVLALAMHWVGVLAQQPRISAASLILLLWGLPFLLYGWSLARWLVFPCSYLFLAIPLNFIDSMTTPLRHFATAAATVVLRGFGLDVYRVGVGLYSGDNSSFAFHVAPECSGLRSLLAMTALIGFYAWWSQKTFGKKWLLFVLSVPVAVVANICRIILVVVAAIIWGQKVAMDLWHDYSGYPIFLIGIALMLLLDRLLNLNYSALWERIRTKYFSPESS